MKTKAAKIRQLPIFTVVFFFSFSSASISLADGYIIRTEHATLGVWNGILVVEPIILSKEPLEFQRTWDLSLRADDTIRLVASGGKPNNGWEMGYDPSGKKPEAFAARPGTKCIVKWTITNDEKKGGRTVQAAEGPLAGWYLNPGNEKIEVEIKGEKVELGTQPIFSKEPFYFDIHDVSP